MLISECVEIAISSGNRKHFEGKGYTIPVKKIKGKRRYCVKRGTKILVKVSDLMPSSCIPIEAQCDFCGLKKTVLYENYRKVCDKNDSKYRCRRCQVATFTSFGEWLETNGFCISDIWAKSNGSDPYELSYQSHEQVILRCVDHGEYITTPNTSVTMTKCRCPSCSRVRTESLIQEKTRLFLDSLGYTLKHEHGCSIRPVNPKTNHFLLYDNEVVDLKLVIEVHGPQHYSPGGMLYCKKGDKGAFMDLQARDEYKKKYALDNGYYYMSIPYWNYKNDVSWKRKIELMIERIKKETQ